MEDYMLPCLFKQTFGFDCMGCGLQRAALLLSEGKFVAAFFMYPAIYPLLILALTLLKYALKPTEKTGRIVIFVAAGNAVVILLAYCIKMKALFL